MPSGRVALLLLLSSQLATTWAFHFMGELSELLQSRQDHFKDQRCDYVVITSGNAVRNPNLREIITKAHENMIPVMLASIEGYQATKSAAKITSRCAFFITDVTGEDFSVVASDIPENMFVVVTAEQKEDLGIDNLVERSFAVLEQKTKNVLLYCHNAAGELKWKPIVGKRWPVCPHPLEGKTLQIACRGYIPGVIFPRQKGGRVSGIEPNLMYILAEKFKFKPHFELSRPNLYENGSWAKGSTISQLLEGRVDLGLGARPMLYLQSQFVEFGDPIYNIEGFWAHRYPIPKRDFLKVTKVFAYGIWLWIAASVFAMSIAFAVFHAVYTGNEEMAHLAQPLLERKFDYFFTTFCTLIDKSSIEWFPTWSAGRFLVLLWSTYSMANVFFYESTLRSTLIAEDYEKPIDSHRDVVERGQTVYIPHNMQRLRHDVSDNPAFATSWDPDALEVFKLAQKTGGYYDLAKSRYRLPNYAINDVHENGASYFTADNVYMYGWFGDKRMGIPNIRMSKLKFNKYPVCGGYARKGNPFMKDFNRLWGWLRDMGFVQKFLWEPLPLEATLPPKMSNRLEPLNFEFMWTPLFCLFIGYVLSLVTFLKETRCKKKAIENLDRPESP